MVQRKLDPNISWLVSLVKFISFPWDLVSRRYDRASCGNSMFWWIHMTYIQTDSCDYIKTYTIHILNYIQILSLSLSFSYTKASEDLSVDLSDLQNGKQSKLEILIVLSLKTKLFWVYVCEFFCPHVCILCICMVSLDPRMPEEVIIWGHHMPWTRVTDSSKCYRLVRAEPGSSGRSAGVLYLWGISATLTLLFRNFVNK